MTWEFTARFEHNYNTDDSVPHMERKIIFNFPPMSSSDLSEIDSSLKRYLKTKLEINCKTEVYPHKYNNQQGHYIIISANSITGNQALFAYFPAIKGFLKGKVSRYIKRTDEYIKREQIQDFQEQLVSLVYLPGGAERLRQIISDFFTKYGRQKHYDRSIKSEWSDAEGPLSEDHIQELANLFSIVIENSPMSVYQHFDEDKLNEYYQSAEIK